MPLRRTPEPISWPGGARFALTIVDDTDGTTLESGPPVYDALTAAGLRVTKTVWVHDTPAPTPVGGSSCAEPDYLDWVRSLQDAGHEIGLHNARDHPSTRAETLAALDRFRDLFGHDPRIGADHVHNLEALYWGSRRLSGWRASAYERLVRVSRPDGDDFQGEVPTSPYFWGDACRGRVTYWRNFTYDDTNLLAPCPWLPYHDPDRPYVNWWYCATDAPDLARLVRALAPDRLDRLEAEGGCCILYTHLGLDASTDGRLDERLQARLDDLAGRPGWYAPASEVLDHLRDQGGSHLVGRRERSALERRWLADVVRARGGREARWALRGVRRGLTGRGDRRWHRTTQP